MSAVRQSAPIQSKAISFLINALSIVVPLVVALLLGIRNKFQLGDWTGYLPHCIGAINTLTTLLLIAAWIAISRKMIRTHATLMTASVALGALFLVCYVTYHLSNESTRYGATGGWRIVYYTILISHIGLSLIVLPLVLRAYMFALTRQFVRHRKTAKLALPVWLYVSATGVIVYLMISPYYVH